MITEFIIEIATAKDTNLIMEVYEYVTMEMSLFGDSTYSMNFDIRVVFHNYNNPVNIELPTGAESGVSYSEYSTYLQSITNPVA
jgi:hypothetical protein